MVERLQTLEAFKKAETVGLYLAIGGEVNLDPLLPICGEAGKRVAIPVFNRELEIYEMAEITASTRFTRGQYGIREPVRAPLVAMKSIDLIAVPGVAFDRRGNRLGRGGGYYDRLLDAYHGFSAAVAFDFQVLDAIPVDHHDQPVDALVTESLIFEV